MLQEGWERWPAWPASAHECRSTLHSSLGSLLVDLRLARQAAQRSGGDELGQDATRGQQAEDEHRLDTVEAQAPALVAVDDGGRHDDARERHADAGRPGHPGVEAALRRAALVEDPGFVLGERQDEGHHHQRDAGGDGPVDLDDAAVGESAAEQRRRDDDDHHDHEADEGSGVTRYSGDVTSVELAHRTGVVRLIPDDLRVDDVFSHVPSWGVVAAGAAGSSSRGFDGMQAF